MFKIPVLKRLIPSIRRRIRVLINKRIFWAKINNIYFKIDIQDKIDREYYFKKEFEKDNFNFINKCSFFRNKFIFLDIGCNSGIYSLNILKNFVNCSMVIAFEPILETFEKFKMNIEKNNFQHRVEHYNYALSDTSEQKKMKSIFRNNKKQSAVYEISSEGDQIVESKIFDKLYNYKNKYIFLKCDTEGHEYEVLLGMKKNLELNNCLILVEIQKNNLKKVSDFLKDLNYVLLKKTNEKNSYFYGKLK